ncbi:penicillin-binding protein 1C [Membranihabitans maritimus]|uniref:penicillin-binding protein 1C n=1 Tax=Membranihabitans maritimus TaxID=2904244 RepID=UPI001F0257CD|nr:penicillin-binding protein 1C [Membranihabitans maritimus]
MKYTCNNLKRKWVVFSLLISGTLLIGYCFFLLPAPLFDDPTSTVLEDKQGQILSARIAEDGQWRFPEMDSLPYKYKTAVRYFEDEYFYYHPGINPVSLMRAAWQNLTSKKIQSGGSTLTMQVIRLSRKNKPRSYLEKVKEIILATRLEWRFSKAEIFRLYASHAPFGGNVVGLQAASWRYFARSPELLSWAETATLAVLPNAPSLIYPGKNQKQLEEKRNRLLDKLMGKGILTKEENELAKSEPLPDKPHPLPQATPHLLNKAMAEGKDGQIIPSTIDAGLQDQLTQLIDRYHSSLSKNEIHNGAILVLDVKNATVKGYIGNTQCKEEGSGSSVDIITAPRSTGSTLKPFLFAAMLEEGMLLPEALIEDIPTRISGYAPQNFDQTYSGAVPADQALTRSLNVPAVRMLQDYGIPPFYNRLRRLGLESIDKGPDHYGLSLILGGAESSLWELCLAYYFMAKKLREEPITSITYSHKDEKITRKLNDFGKGSIYQTFEVLTGLNRPFQEGAWKIFDSSRKIAWKTGTSFGFRDAWAIGITPEYIVGIWAGNADGEGRPGLTGIQTAAPILFDAFDLLPPTSWFYSPEMDLTTINTCSKSGYRASVNCSGIKEMNVVKNGLKFPSCPYHHKIHLDETKQYQVNSRCYPVHLMKEEKWFVLPTVQEWYYKTNNPDYRSLPPFMESCNNNENTEMQLIYPTKKMQIFLAKDLDGYLNPTIFELAHRKPGTKVFWFIDEEYLGYTRQIHKMEIITTEGMHKITIVDENGNDMEKDIEFIGR